MEDHPLAVEEEQAGLRDGQASFEDRGLDREIETRHHDGLDFPLAIEHGQGQVEGGALTESSHHVLSGGQASRRDGPLKVATIRNGNGVRRPAGGEDLAPGICRQEDRGVGSQGLKPGERFAARLGPTLLDFG